MTIVWSNPRTADDPTRRARLHAGEVVVYPASPQSLALVSHARAIIATAFGDRDPERADDELPPAEFATAAEHTASAFTDHPDTAALTREVLRSAGCDLAQTYLDHPRLRVAAPDTDVECTALAPGRITWWIPVFAVVVENTVTFHPHGTDTVTAESPDASAPVRIVPDRGGVVTYSAYRMRPRVSNASGRTRFTIDFRTLHSADAHPDDLVGLTCAADLVTIVDIQQGRES